MNDELTLSFFNKYQFILIFWLITLESNNAISEVINDLDIPLPLKGCSSGGKLCQGCVWSVKNCIIKFKSSFNWSPLTIPEVFLM